MPFKWDSKLLLILLSHRWQKNDAIIEQHTLVLEAILKQKFRPKDFGLIHTRHFVKKYIW